MLRVGGCAPEDGAAQWPQPASGPLARGRLTQHGCSQPAVEGGAAALLEQHGDGALHATQLGVHSQPQPQRVQRVGELHQGQRAGRQAGRQAGVVMGGVCQCGPMVGRCSRIGTSTA